MRLRLTAWVAAGMLAVVIGAASPTQAQIAENRLSVRLVGIGLDSGSLDENGALPPNTPVEIWFAHSVLVPALTVCPFQTIPLQWALKLDAPYAHGFLTTNQVNFGVEPVSSLYAREYGAFSASAYVWVDEGAPSGSIMTATIVAQALGSSTLSGCNLSSSSPIEATVAVRLA